ncbi:MAG: response regulator [Ignavibacteriales bacterium]|nr:response regulator [Ignavibacteriales bacterium]
MKSRTAENGTEGIKLGTETEFDLAVIDLKMPDVDGIEVLKTNKKEISKYSLLYCNCVCKL